MAQEIRISLNDARSAKVSIDALGQDLESAAKFPAFPYVGAPIAENACDDIQPFWNRTVDGELDGAEALGLAFTLIAERFGAAEERLTAALADLEIVAPSDRATR